MSTALHICAASSGVAGAIGEKKTSAIGLTMALLPSAMTRSLKNAVFDSPSLIAAKVVALLP